jgi:hypothetical protein
MIRAPARTSFQRALSIAKIECRYCFFLPVAFLLKMTQHVLA